VMWATSVPNLVLLACACVRSTMLHGSETWAPTASDLQWLRINDRAMIRWICGAKLADKISTAVLHQKLDLDEITAVLRTRRLRWYGRVQRATSCINAITRLELPGTRDRGRPRKTWSACVRNDMTICNLDGVNPLDRNSWRTSVRRCQVRCCLPRSPGQPQHLKYQNRI